MRSIAVLIVLAAVGRFAFGLNSVPLLESLPVVDRDFDLATDLPDQITSVRYQAFDPDAVLVVQPGPDGMPGSAGGDDNMNGVIDDRAELGATNSDDQCVTLSADQLAMLPTDDVLVLQHGVFVDVDQPRPRSNSRAFLFGLDNRDRPWSIIGRSGR